MESSRHASLAVIAAAPKQRVASFSLPDEVRDVAELSRNPAFSVDRRRPLI